MGKHGLNKEIFGHTEDGQSVYRVRLTGGGLRANIITWGAVLQDLRLEGHEPPLVLGFNEFQYYPAHSQQYGSIPGRVANRISNASFKLDNKIHEVNANVNNKHTLHGGEKGTGTSNWQIADLGTSHVDLTLLDPDGHMGFPGNCHHTCSYVLKENGVLHITTTTKTDAPTIAGLTHHSYFNLDGSENILDHDVQILCDTYLPLNKELIPTGEILSVENTHLDFRQSKAIGGEITGENIIDNNYCLAKERGNMRRVAKAHSAKSGITMDVSTTEPGLQFYAGHKVTTPVPGLMDQPYDAYSGFCFEAQNWPDAQNHKGFPSITLNPGEELRQVTEYQFSKN